MNKTKLISIVLAMLLVSINITNAAFAAPTDGLINPKDGISILGSLKTPNVENKINLQPRLGGGDSGFIVIGTKTFSGRYNPAELDILYAKVKALKDSDAHTFLSFITTVIAFIPGTSVGFSIMNNGLSALSNDLSKDEFVTNSYEAIIEALLQLRGHQDCDVTFNQTVDTYDDLRRKLTSPLIFSGLVKGHHN